MVEIQKFLQFQRSNHEIHQILQHFLRMEKCSLFHIIFQMMKSRCSKVYSSDRIFKLLLFFPNISETNPIRRHFRIYLASKWQNVHERLGKLHILRSLTPKTLGTHIPTRLFPNASSGVCRDRKRNIIQIVGVSMCECPTNNEQQIIRFSYFCSLFFVFIHFELGIN